MSIVSLTAQDLTLNPLFSVPSQPFEFFDFQQNAKLALDQLIVSQSGSLLILKTETLPEYIQEIKHYFSTKQTTAIIQTHFTRESLFGYQLYLEKENQIKFVEGTIQQAHHKTLVLNLNHLLLDITLWDKLKQALLFGHFQPIAANHLPKKLPTIQSQFKLLLIGSRDDIATLYSYDDTLYQYSNYAEIDSYIKVNEQTLVQWGNYISTQSLNIVGEHLTPCDQQQFLHAYIRESESQHLLSISPTQIKRDLLGIKHFYQIDSQLNRIQAYFDQQEQQAKTLNSYIKQDILTEQQHIETEGEKIGQINGLSVIEFDGVPYSFGEPLRISCNVQMGEGEITDIERKVELGGNIHSKGIIIAQSCLSHLLELPTQLPFSASLAFEQSYGEIDGDSSSLAIFCVLISALAQLPISQTIAITGAIDQFGNVLSVGGVNQKIEGFFDICHTRGLTGKQGVIIPASCLSHLSLKQSVCDAIADNQFAIWTVENVFDALHLLFERHFYAESEPTQTKTAIFDLIHSLLEQSEQAHTSGSLITKICKMLHLN